MLQNELLEKIIDVLECLEIPYMLTGSQASTYYGEPRFTRDIDIVADMKKENIKDFIKFFPPDEFYCDEEMILNEIIYRGQFNIIHSTSALKIDIILTKPNLFSQTEFSRRLRSLILPNREANIVTPEDIIIKKMEFYKQSGSDRHLRDITGILKISGAQIDKNYIFKWSGRLELMEIWDAIQKSLVG